VGQSLVLALALLLLMVVATGSAGSILDAVMGRLQWGKVQPVRAVLTHAGCEQLNLATGQGICSMPAGADTPAVICPLELRSRIGTQVLLASASPASAVSDALQQPGWQVPLERKSCWPGRRFPKDVTLRCADRALTTALHFTIALPRRLSLSCSRDPAGAWRRLHRFTESNSPHGDHLPAPRAPHRPTTRR
jgi:hypothetical protein